MNKKVLITILVILILTVIVGGFWYYLRSQNNANLTRKSVGKTEKVKVAENNIGDKKEKENNQQEKNKIKSPDTEDWRTAKWIIYIDRKNGFKFKYPDSHFIDILDGKSKYKYLREGDIRVRHFDTVRYRNEISGPYDAPETNVVEISVRENGNNLALIKWLQKNDERCAGCVQQKPDKCNKFNCNFYRMRMIKINGKEALVLSEPSIMDNEAVYFDLGDKVVKFHGQGITLDFGNGDNFFKKMVESFEIVK